MLNALVWLLERMKGIRIPAEGPGRGGQTHGGDTQLSTVGLVPSCYTIQA